MGFGNNTFGTDTMYVHYEKLLEALLKYAELSPVPWSAGPQMPDYLRPPPPCGPSHPEMAGLCL